MDDYYDDSADYAPDSRKKRKGTTASPFLYVDINTLPPVETIKNEDLKNFTREELLTYLHHQGQFSKYQNPHINSGIEANPSETKPALKQMLRQVISDIEKRKAGIPLDLGSPATYTPRSEDRERISHFYSFLTFLAKMCADCGTKKSNRECLYHRCKGCCNKREFQCSVHRDGREAPSSPPMTPMRAFNGPVIFVPPGSLATKNGAPPVMRAGGLASGPRQISVQPIAPPAKPAPPVTKEIKFAECPNCKDRVAFIGSHFFTHLYKCDPQLFARMVTSGEVITNSS
jgi:LRP1 type putative zinc finger protein